MIVTTGTVPAGILLPQSTLNETWFIVLSTVVAFNTIIYVGLTLSKLIPWPRQLHPARVRVLLMRVGIQSKPEATVSAIVTPERPESDDPYEALRRSLARRQIPQAFALLAGLVVLFALSPWNALTTRSIADPVIQLSVALAFLLLAQILSRRGFRGATMRWVWVVGNLVLVGLMLEEAADTQSLAPVGYALVVMTMFAPITLAWRPTLMASAMMLAAVLVTSLLSPEISDARVVAAAMGALLGGFVLLHLRLGAIDEIASERRRSQLLASTDSLTGALSREGLLTLLPGLASTAERTGQSVCVMLFDIDGLSRANHEYGTHYGDDVIRAVSAAIDATVRRGDLVARWGGDEFVVAGLGGKPSADALAGRIQESVRAGGVGLGKWPISVSVGTVAGLPAETTFEALLDAATVAQEASAT